MTDFALSKLRSIFDEIGWLSNIDKSSNCIRVITGDDLSTQIICRIENWNLSLQIYSTTHELENANALNFCTQWNKRSTTPQVRLLNSSTFVLENLHLKYVLENEEQYRSLNTVAPEPRRFSLLDFFLYLHNSLDTELFHKEEMEDEDEDDDDDDWEEDDDESSDDDDDDDWEEDDDESSDEDDDYDWEEDDGESSDEDDDDDWEEDDGESSDEDDDESSDEDDDDDNDDEEDEAVVSVYWRDWCDWCNSEGDWNIDFYKHDKIDEDLILKVHQFLSGEYDDDYDYDEDDFFAQWYYIGFRSRNFREYF